MKKRKTKGERITVEEQLDRWVNGDSVHNLSRGECCPDFSCCNPELQTPVEVRRKFAKAAPAERDAMLGKFLGAMLKNYGMKVSTSGGRTR